MKKFLRILSCIGYLLCTYLFVSLFAAVFCFAGDTFDTFKNSERMLITPENVEITGNDRLSREDILFVAGLDKKISFFDADSKKMTLNLSTCGWVKKAFVEKFFPNSVLIHIEEFKPAMIVTSRKKSSDSDKDSFMPWFSDADGILFIPLKVFSERWMEGNPLPVKRELRHFCTAMDVFITTKDNTIDVFVRDYKIRRLRRRHIQTIVTMGGGKFYRYEYNCEEKVWKLMDD